MRRSPRRGSKSEARSSSSIASTCCGRHAEPTKRDRQSVVIDQRECADPPTDSEHGRQLLALARELGIATEGPTQ
ncbi:hypothetical protein GR247_31605 [Rhizobium leguminosarum]|nr:hypothetical protein [Rhizobium leguminosarum]NKK58987.1 hypothetical protein [Rhizobium leguminosarum bv. viciae]